MMKTLFLILTAFLETINFAQGYSTEIYVSKDSTGDYSSIQAAIDATKAFPDLPIKIFIKQGVYHEKVRVYSWNTHLSLIGDKNGETVIVNNDHFKSVNLGRNSTFHTYTVKVEANDFYASDLIIENSAGDVGQAVALHVEADRVHFENCTFLGHQDTMYLSGENDRQYFNNCTVTGTTDFIFGSSTALFDQCDIISKKGSYITAASTNEISDFGFVFRECKLSNSDLAKASTYLGRPWRGYAKTVFISCEMGEHIHPSGWKEWHTGGETYYAEYGSHGPGGFSSDRVDWSFQLSKEQANRYIIKNIFKGWVPDSD
ncbi:MAG: pectinesterase [Cyclobacteriaceae bacterium]|jgi:pectinesterase